MTDVASFSLLIAKENGVGTNNAVDDKSSDLMGKLPLSLQVVEARFLPPFCALWRNMARGVDDVVRINKVNL